jgi:predicted nucleic acid-binding protein
MKVLLDTNIILDFALERQPYFEICEEIFSLVEMRILAGYISASTFGDLYYIIRKNKGRVSALSFLQKLFSICQIATVNSAAIEMALAINFRDFEDGIQYSTAIINQLEAIVTRNPQDFQVDRPRILTPSQLISEINNGASNP